eukprot:5968994-Pyramimonas_sp.AAC.1
MPDSPEDIAAGFCNSNAMYLGNSALSSVTIPSLRMCARDSVGGESLCYDVKSDDWTYTGGGVPGAMTASNYHKIIAALSGQIPDGENDNGVH